MEYRDDIRADLNCSPSGRAVSDPTVLLPQSKEEKKGKMTDEKLRQINHK